MGSSVHQLLRAVVALAGVRHAWPRRRPEYILTEEHHHVVAHLVAQERGGRLRSGATLVHFDSHHDMGLPGVLGDVRDGPHDALLEFTAINNFLLALGYAGTVGAIIFVEPPWSLQCGELHGRTLNLTVGRDAGGAGRVYVEGGYALDGFFDDGQVVDAAAELRDAASVAFTVIPFASAAATLPALLGAADVILDVDLDAFATTSPGALTLRNALPPPALRRLYRLAHGLCVMDGAYDFAASDPPCVRESLAPGVDRGAASPFVRELVDVAARFCGPWERERTRAVAGLLVAHEVTLLEVDAALGNVAAKLEAFLTQPFNDEPGAVGGALDHFEHILRSVFGDRDPPAAVTTVRSPFYGPAELLPAAECGAYDVFAEAFGKGGSLHVQEDVDVDRVGCARRHPAAAANASRYPTFDHVDARILHAVDVDGLFTFAPDDAYLEVVVSFLRPRGETDRR